VNTAHGTEIARAEHRLRLQQLAEHALEEFGVEADALVAEYGPEVPVPVIGDEEALPSRFERAAAERRAADAQRQLDRLGKVNPLALEEFEALTERHAFWLPSWTTSVRPGVTCSPWSRRSTTGCRRCSPPPTPTPRASSSTSSAACSPAARATWC
jgi:hypothetical protein